MTTRMLLKLYEIKNKTINGELAHIINVKSYLPFSEKDELVKSVIKQTFKRRESGGLKSFSSVRSKVFTERILSAYTNIEADDTTYDALAGVGLLLPILRLIGDEYEMCSKMLGAYLDDIINGFVELEDL